MNQTHTFARTLRDACELFWRVADSSVKRRLALALALVAVGAVLVAVSPVALKFLIDSLSDPDHLGPIGAVLSLSTYLLAQYLWRCSVEARTLVHGQAEQRFRRLVGRRLFEHVVRLPLEYHLERKAGAIGEIAEQGIRGYQLLLQHAIYTVLPTVIELALAAVVLISLGHASYLFVFGLASLAYVIVFHKGARAIEEPSKRVSTSHVNAHALLTDTLVNQETVKYFDAERVVCQRYDIALGQTESAWMRFFKLRMTNGLIVSSIFAASLGLSLIQAAADVARGAMTVGDFVLINSYVVRLAQPLEMLGFAIRDVTQGLAFLSNMLGLFHERAESDSPRKSIRDGRGHLVFERVTFSYRQGRTVLRDVTFEIPPGRTVAIVGTSGSGKSSLIRLLFRLYQPAAGTIFLDGIPIEEMSLSEVRRSIAVVPQDTVLFHDTIVSNIGFGRFGSSLAEIQDAARIANLHDFIMSLPEGYETVVGERGLKLSGGERQRVAIARAALKRPRIYVFDEATSSLDSKTERDILSNLVDVSKKCTTLVIAHRLSTIVHSDEILVLDRGAVVERGTHTALRERDGPYAALWKAQQSGSSPSQALASSIA